MLRCSGEQTDRKIPPLMSSCAPLTALETLICILRRVSGLNPRDLRVVRLKMSVWALVSATAWVIGFADLVFARGLGRESFKLMTHVGFFVESECHWQRWGRSGGCLYPVDQIYGFNSMCGMEISIEFCC